MGSIPPVVNHYKTKDGHPLTVVCTCDNRSPDSLLPLLAYACYIFDNSIHWAHHHKGHLHLGVDSNSLTLWDAKRLYRMYLDNEAGNSISLFDRNYYKAPTDGVMYSHYDAILTRDA